MKRATTVGQQINSKKMSKTNVAMPSSLGVTVVMMGSSLDER